MSTAFLSFLGIPPDSSSAIKPHFEKSFFSKSQKVVVCGYYCIKDPLPNVIRYFI